MCMLSSCVIYKHFSFISLSTSLLIQSSHNSHSLVLFHVRIFKVLRLSLVPLTPCSNPFLSVSQSDHAHHEHTVPLPISKKDIPFHLLELQTILDVAVIFPVQ